MVGVTLCGLFLAGLLGNPLIGIALLFFEVPAALVGLPMRFLVRGPVRWSPWDFGIFLWPFATWLLGTVLTDHHKGYGNLYVDPMVLSIIVPAYYLARAMLRGRDEPIWHVPILQAVACFAGLIIGIAMPQIGSNC